jgi:hypothetical protein
MEWPALIQPEANALPTLPAPMIPSCMGTSIVVDRGGMSLRGWKSRAGHLAGAQDGNTFDG